MRRSAAALQVRKHRFNGDSSIGFHLPWHGASAPAAASRQPERSHALWPDRPAADAPEERCRKLHGHAYVDSWIATNFTLCASKHEQGSRNESSIHCFSDPEQPGQTACISRNIVLDSEDFMGPRKQWQHHQGKGHARVQAEGKAGAVKAACQIKSLSQHEKYLGSPSIKPWLITSLQARGLCAVNPNLLQLSLCEHAAVRDCRADDL